jgi:hypothetical protein
MTLNCILHLIRVCLLAEHCTTGVCACVGGGGGARTMAEYIMCIFSSCISAHVTNSMELSTTREATR